ncbi:MAG: hypothetical protein IM620_21530, partial [Cytophagales bacterium]|nr:hypothetical protein [Cytophagales bacterium]
MTINSLDQLISRRTSGFTFTNYFNYQARDATQTIFTDLSRFISSGGSPLNAATGTSLAWTPCNESTGNGTEVFGLQHGGNVSPATKHITDITFSFGGCAGIAVLLDVQGYWANINFNTTAVQNLTGTPGSNLRYTNGTGCVLYMTSYSSSATSANVTISYTNQAGTTGRSLRRTFNKGACSIDQLIGTANGTDNNFGTFFPLADGDTGVANVASITFNNATTGTGNLFLARPLLYVYNYGTTGTFYTETNFLSYFPS